MRSRLGSARRLLGGGLVVVLLASCTTYRPLKVDELPGGVREGDRLSMTLKDGKTTQLTVAGVTGDLIRGQGGETVSVADIETIHVAEVDTREIARKGLIGTGTALLVLFWAGVFALLMLAAE
jgi:hypothetical protein